MFMWSITHGDKFATLLEVAEYLAGQMLSVNAVNFVVCSPRSADEAGKCVIGKNPPVLIRKPFVNLVDAFRSRPAEHLVLRKWSGPFPDLNRIASPFVDPVTPTSIDHVGLESNPVKLPPTP